VLEFGFQLDYLVYTYVVDHTYTQFLLAPETELLSNLGVSVLLQTVGIYICPPAFCMHFPPQKLHVYLIITSMIQLW